MKTYPYNTFLAAIQFQDQFLSILGLLTASFCEALPSGSGRSTLEHCLQMVSKHPSIPFERKMLTSPKHPRYLRTSVTALCFIHQELCLEFSLCPRSWMQRTVKHGLPLGKTLHSEDDKETLCGLKKQSKNGMVLRFNDLFLLS